MREFSVSHAFAGRLEDEMSLDKHNPLATKGSCFSEGPPFIMETPRSSPKQPGLSMAHMTGIYLNRGCWSYDALLKSAEDYLQKPPESQKNLTKCAGHLKEKDLCGFLSGGIMAISLFTGHALDSDAETLDRCWRLAREYTSWWLRHYPSRCQENIRPCHFRKMGTEASEFLQDLFERELQEASSQNVSM